MVEENTGISVRSLHVLVVVGCKHKGCSAVAQLANQLWHPMSLAVVILKTMLACELPSTTLLLAFERFFLEVHSLDVS